ncbi:MAG: hypothetical protein HF974_04355 [ANME-2 cluster archaeon]|nr:hypothetical protein [ANME-2 cluster archaeon]
MLYASGHRRFKVQTNPQGWLPPAALMGCGGRGRGYHMYFYCYIFLQPPAANKQNIHSAPTDRWYPCISEAPKSACLPPHHKGSRADQDGHPGRVKVRGGGRRAGEKTGAEENGDVNDNFLFQVSI